MNSMGIPGIFGCQKYRQVVGTPPVGVAVVQQEVFGAMLNGKLS